MELLICMQKKQMKQETYLNPYTKGKADEIEAYMWKTCSYKNFLKTLYDI